MALKATNFFTEPEYKLQDDLILDIRDLHVSFKVKDGIMQAVRGVDLKVKKGAIVGIVGESGSGKSVCVKSIIGFNDGAKTTAKLMNFKNIDISKIKKHQWQYYRGTYVSYISQDPLFSLNPTMTIGRQVKEAIYVSCKRRYYQTKSDLKYDLQTERIDLDTYKEKLAQAKETYKAKTTKAAVHAKTLEILNFIGIDQAEKRLKAFPSEFSGGMRQRIVIAIAVATEPDLIIADEPTTALDVTIQAKALNLIKQLRDLLNITIIFISHNISLIANFCDFVYVMYAGRLVEKGLVEEIFTNPVHPYTWALMASIPEGTDKNAPLTSIPGYIPNMLSPPKGDAFAARNQFALAIDFEHQPPFFDVTETHKAATWLLHPQAPKVEMPADVKEKIAITRKALAIKMPSQPVKQPKSNGNKKTKTKSAR
ncbi:ABC transporter ATP-binding protein [Mycoplasmoides pneumoniae]|uniref:ABC-type dipeptide/oligopeptide/nickel transport system ATP-binding protein (DppD/OppD) n=2 Tax=Mycoplasmoides pneumoniae TaxID=2104 RepID=A0AAX0SR36_MYCPM|nr:ABC transporter ATP-binding protein [Mycoplasmoides pneumoniae]ALA31055.1 peptide ABC transporter ATP-binding protein [Mycoplasmoides pneumoniae 19294]ALA31497.1 peptide ABC transporter ATP-binding protein [Mycoplasmoides pneumoniae 39443]ALA35730.1 peptide ABC transporter ATP-binding protein [Mycoplasmoides pneumoniae FH]ALA36437.1 peptide ABC transporter ATP-binding protein [Mycoplasmoides pneumoniae M1139]ALA37145.1 peptide ABC transporter ATP-binding protein [Mycoplasmoides pneumoniae]